VAELPGGVLAEALQRVALPAYITDREGVFTWLNDATRAHFGDLLGKHYSTIVAPEELPHVREQFARKLLGGARTDYETTLVDVRGRRVRVEISSVPLERGGRAEGVFGLVVLGRATVAGPKTRPLTPRQLQVLQLLAAGASTHQIADELTLSRETVRNHVRHILRALGAHSRLEAVATARTAGLLRDA
jgi:PAS domain S-box-containing protein